MMIMYKYFTTLSFLFKEVSCYYFCMLIQYTSRILVMSVQAYSIGTLTVSVTQSSFFPVERIKLGPKKSSFHTFCLPLPQINFADFYQSSPEHIQRHLISFSLPLFPFSHRKHQIFLNWFLLRIYNRNYLDQLYLSIDGLLRITNISQKNNNIVRKRNKPRTISEFCTTEKNTIN